MKQKYSFKILKYIYNELPFLDKLETEFAIEECPDWKKEHKILRSGYDLLPKVLFFPKKHVVKNILSYSTSTAA